MSKERKKQHEFIQIVEGNVYLCKCIVDKLNSTVQCFCGIDNVSII